ncbi:hypothetical protein JCM10908_002520 [Rhodotorula pacifica]|uniref:uncharacterized protein n=1 Tax=Rhodotorula pacifica TaxID=1495444 RepID=UPI00317B8C0E
MLLPPVPAGANPYLAWSLYLQARWRAVPSAGFRGRLIVLWILAAYGIVAAALYSLALCFECRRRGNSFWLWRFVRRPNGRYVVGNQRTLFALFSAISCGVYIAYFSSFYTIYINNGTGSGGAMFWRMVSWLPSGLHLYISSWANLQAAIISSQVVAGRQLLGPIPLNTVYIAGAVVGVVAVITLSLVGMIYWTQFWTAIKALGAALFAYAIQYPEDSADAATERIALLLAAVNRSLGPFTSIARAQTSTCAAGALLVIAINFGGFALLLTLHRQIKCVLSAAFSHSRAPVNPLTPLSPANRFNLIEEITESQPFIEPSSRIEPEPTHPPRWPRGCFPWSKKRHPARQSSPTSEDYSSRSASTGTRITKRKLPTRTLERIARDMSPTNSMNRQKAMRLLELHKTERDVLALLLVIVFIASLYGATELWFAIDPFSAGQNWQRLEIAYFLVPWTYLCTVDGVLTFLLINTLRHLGSNYPDACCGGATVHQTQAQPVMQQQQQEEAQVSLPPLPVLHYSHNHSRSHSHSHDNDYARSNIQQEEEGSGTEASASSLAGEDHHGGDKNEKTKTLSDSDSDLGSGSGMSGSGDVSPGSELAAFRMV